MMHNGEIILYGTQGCHLCELAEALVVAECLERSWDFSLALFDIAEQDDLMSRYGTRIPVLCRKDTGKELNWPFDQESVRLFLNPLGI